MKTTLIIIDMQPEFESANVRFVIEGCKREMERAMDSDEPIILVEYRNIQGDGHDYYSPTIQPLARLVDGYPHKFVCQKEFDDGGYDVSQLMFEHGLPSEARICGVNTNCCVWDTTKSLRRMGVMGVLVADATNLSGYSHATEDEHFSYLLGTIRDRYKSNGYPIDREDHLRKLWEDSLADKLAA